MSQDLKESMLQLIADYNRVSAELNQQLTDNGTEFFAAFFKQLFDEHDGLNRVAILGWTPGFNDGDPCTHHTEVFVGRDTYGSPDYDDYGEVQEFFTGSDDADENPNGACKTLEQVYKTIVNFEDIIERMYETDFIITAARNADGSATVEVDQYDCGY